MDVMYEESVESQCKSIFASDQSSIRERFTRLWTQIICEKENDVTKKNNGQTNLFKV